jgi:hypothetical protein
MFTIFNRMMWAPNVRATSTVFHSTINFRARLDMMDSAADFAFEAGELKSNWQKLKNQIAHASQRRNVIVHSVEVFDNRKDESSHAMFLSPNFVDENKYEKLNSGRWERVGTK